MQKLHMVGFTTDHRGLIFSVRRGAKSGGYVINIDAPIIEAVDELKALLVEEANADPGAALAAANRPQSALSVREIQARLRRGRTVEQVAREAGVEPSWISRFAVPVLAEQAEVIRAARATRMIRQRTNLSVLSLGDAVYRNLAERGVTDPRDQLDKAWRARQLTEGMWLIAFTYSSRGRENKAQWEYDEANRVVRARGRLGGVIGFRQGPRRAVATTAKRASRAKKGAAKKGAVKKGAKKTGSRASSAAKRSSSTSKAATPRTTIAKRAAAAAPTTARQSSSRQATKRVSAARRAAAARLEAEAERATRRDIAAVRKAAKRPVVIPPRLTPLPMFGSLLVDPPEDAASEADLELQWDAAAPLEPDPMPEPEPDVAPEEDELEPEAEVEPEDEVEEESDPDPEPDPEPEFEAEDDPDEEVEDELDEPEAEEPEVDEPEPAPAATPQVRPLRPPRRREPLRARPRAADAEGNGPVFRSDLAPVASDVHDVPRSAVGQSPDVPLSMPIKPIEPPPRRRRIRSLRGR